MSYFSSSGPSFDPEIFDKTNQVLVDAQAGPVLRPDHIYDALEQFMNHIPEGQHVEDQYAVFQNCISITDIQNDIELILQHKQGYTIPLSIPNSSERKLEFVHQVRQAIKCLIEDAQPNHHHNNALKKIEKEIVLCNNSYAYALFYNFLQDIELPYTKDLMSFMVNILIPSFSHAMRADFESEIQNLDVNSIHRRNHNNPRKKLTDDMGNIIDMNEKNQVASMDVLIPILIHILEPYHIASLQVSQTRGLLLGWFSKIISSFSTKSL